MSNEIYLQHHGILGQKWGVRRYQNADGSLTNAGRKRYAAEEHEYEKAANAKTKIGKSYHTYNAEQMHAENKRVENFNNAKGIKDKWDNSLYGHKGKATLLEGDSEGYKKLEATKKEGSYRQKRLNQKAANAQYMADYHKAKANLDLGQKLVEETIYNGTYANTKYQRLSGRTTTLGKEAVNYGLTLGLAGLVLDAKYIADQKKSK